MPKRVPAFFLCVTSLALVAPTAIGESFDLRLEPLESQLLPMSGGSVLLESLSLIEGANILLVSGISDKPDSASSEVPFYPEVWRLEDGTATLLDIDLSGDKAPATQSQSVVFVDGGLPGAMGNPVWAHLGDERIAVLDVVGMQAVLVVQEAGKAVSARVPVSGLPFSARITGLHNQIYVMTKYFLQEDPPRQALRVSRLEIVQSP